jgi:hypothetical protein
VPPHWNFATWDAAAHSSRANSNLSSFASKKWLGASFYSHFIPRAVYLVHSKSGEFSAIDKNYCVTLVRPWIYGVVQLFELCQKLLLRFQFSKLSWLSGECVWKLSKWVTRESRPAAIFGWETIPPSQKPQIERLTRSGIIKASSLQVIWSFVFIRKDVSVQKMNNWHTSYSASFNEKLLS